MTKEERREKIIALGSKEIRRRLLILQQYQMDLYRINEQSVAADRESDRTFEAVEEVRSCLREAIKREQEQTE